MALIKCPDCGKEFSDQAPACPNCGRPNQTTEGAHFSQPQPNMDRPPIPPNLNGRPNVTVSPSQPFKKNSGLSIAALIFSILGCTFIIGVILAIIDLCKKDTTQKHTLSKVALGISAFWLIISIVAGSGSGDTKKESLSVTTETITETVLEPSSEDTAPQTTASEPESQSVESIEESETPVETFPAETKEEFIASCQEISYKTLARTPDDYIGQRIVLTIKISQVMQGGWFDDSEYYRVYTNDKYDMWMGDEYFMYDSRIEDSTKILKDDVWKVYAEFIGTETVTRALSGTKEDVPAIKIYYADLVSE